MTIRILVFAFLMLPFLAQSQSVGIGTENPDSSAVLDLSSSSQGILVPRMTDAQRDAINEPADGLLVYVTTDSSFYCFDGTSWVTLNERTSGLMDDDKDTQVMVESSPDEDVIHFNMEGVEYFRMDSGRLEVHNTGRSVFIGRGAGANDDFSDNGNVAVGDSALRYNTAGYNNTAIGRDALRNNTTGIRNVAIGTSALDSNLTGSTNTAVGIRTLWKNATGNANSGLGYEALGNNKTGYANTSVGQWSMYYNETGSYNSALGYEALATNTGGNYNVALGRAALYHNKASNNTAVGYQALYYDTTGTENIAIGPQVLFFNRSGSHNTGSGFRSLYKNATGSFNTSTGWWAMFRNESGSYNTATGITALHNSLGSFNTATGARSLETNTSGGGNTASGHGALFLNTTGSENAAFGNRAIRNGTTSNYNVAVGSNTMLTNTKGNLNTVIGYNSDVGADSLENATAIGANAVVGQSHSMVLGDNVNVGIGTSTPDTTFHIVGKVKIQDGTQGAGKVLVSDASGMATWSTGALGLMDTDDDTKVVVEQTADDDIIRFDMEGVEYFRMDSGRLEVHNTGQSVYIGAGAGLHDDFTYNQSVGIGDSSLATNAGTGNTAIGFESLKDNNSGFWNTAVGDVALTQMVSGWANTAVGSFAAFSDTAGIGNTSIGYATMVHLRTGNGNTTIGSSANQLLASGSNNVAIGVQSNINATHGNSNTAVGSYTMVSNIKGSDNTMLGYRANVGADSLVNATAIGANATVNTSNSLILGSSANVGVGTSSPSAKLHVVGYERIEHTGNTVLDVVGSNTIGSWLNIKNTSTDGGNFNLISTGSANGEGVNKFLIRSETAWFSNGLDPGFQMDSKNQIGLGVNNPSAQLSMGEWNDGRPGDSIQLMLSGWHNWGANNGSTTGTYKLKIEGYQNDGMIVYPLHVMDENSLTDFYLRNRIGAGNLPLMYFAGEVGIGTETPSTIIDNSKMDVVGGHIAISNNYGVLSYNNTNDGIGAGFDTDTNDDLFLYARGVNRMTIGNVSGDLTLHTGGAYKIGGGTWTAISDRRLKKEITNYERGLDDILKIQTRKFRYNQASGYDTEKEFVGVVAQELEEIAPEMIGHFEKDGEEYMSVNNSDMTYMLINAVQEQQVLINQLLEKNKELEARLLSIEGAVVKK